MSAGAFANRIHTSFDKRNCSELHNYRYKSSFVSNKPRWLQSRRESSVSKVCVASDYSDFLPESTNHFTKHGYHHLEEYKKPRRKTDLFLPDVELARTIVETNHKAVLVLAGRLHCQPHGHSLWSEFEYRIDDRGDIFFELPDEGLLHDPHAPYFHVRVLIGMDSPFYSEKGILPSCLNNDDIRDELKPAFSDDEVEETYFNEILDKVEEVTGFLMERGMPETLQQTHPLHFVKCLGKVVNCTIENKRVWPSNALSIVGTLESCRNDYLWRSYYPHDYDHERGDGGYESDCSGAVLADKEGMKNFNELRTVSVKEKKNEEEFSYSFVKSRNKTSTLYRLEIGTMELFSVYGNQTEVHHQIPFCEVEPDDVACSAREIIDRLHEYGTHYFTALKALCRKKKSLIVDKAEIIGVDRLGFDVRAILGTEMKALRFTFSSRARTDTAAEKKIMRMLFTKSYAKYLQTTDDDIRKP